MLRTKRQGIQAGREAVSTYKEQKRSLEFERAELRENREEIEAEIRETAGQLAEGLLRRPTDEAIAKVAEETGAIHLHSQLEKLRDQLEDAKRRIVEIAETDEFIRRDELTHPITGTYSCKVNEFAAVVSDLESAMRPFDLEEFQWLYGRDFGAGRERGAFSRFWRAITFADSREKKAEAIVLDKLDYETFSACRHDFERTRQHLEDNRAELGLWTRRKKNVLALISEKSELEDWSENFDDEALAELREELADHIAGVSFSELFQRVRPAGRQLAAKGEALTKKLEYLDDMERFLTREIKDRQTRIDSINRVCNKWKRNPHGFLRGDKSRWLVEVPRLKQQSTVKRVGWMRTMRTNVHRYDRYDEYGAFLFAGAHFLPYDLMSWKADERMPYEGFSRGVISEIEDFRIGQSQDRADFSEFSGVVGGVEEFDSNWDDEDQNLDLGVEELIAIDALAQEDVGFEFSDES